MALLNYFILNKLILWRFFNVLDPSEKVAVARCSVGDKAKKNRKLGSSEDDVKRLANFSKNSAQSDCVQPLRVISKCTELVTTTKRLTVVMLFLSKVSFCQSSTLVFENKFGL